MVDTKNLESVCAAVVRLLREERERRGITGYLLAAESGLNQSTISLMDRGLRKPTLDTLLRITSVLGIQLGEVILQAETETGFPGRTPRKKATSRK